MLFSGGSNEHATPLYSRWMCSPLLVLDLGLDIVNGIRGLDLEGDGLAGEGLHEDLHGDVGVDDRCRIKKGVSMLRFIYYWRSLNHARPRACSESDIVPGSLALIKHTTRPGPRKAVRLTLRMSLYAVWGMIESTSLRVR